MKNWIKLWWHCLFHLPFGKHRMNKMTILETGKVKVYHFCSCSYLAECLDDIIIDNKKAGR